MGLFTGKGVVLTCSAPHILDFEQDFSGYDYVCRVNSQIPLTDDMIRCTGDRVDVWYPAKRILKELPHLCEIPSIIRAGGGYKGLVPKDQRHKFQPMTAKRSSVKRQIDSGPNRGLLAA